MGKKLKVWIGNLDGSREGLVVAPSKTQARKVIGRTSAADFNAHWREFRGGVPAFEPEVLYTRRYGASMESWFRGRCP